MRPVWGRGGSRDASKGESRVGLGVGLQWACSGSRGRGRGRGRGHQPSTFFRPGVVPKGKRPVQGWVALISSFRVNFLLVSFKVEIEVSWAVWVTADLWITPCIHPPRPAPQMPPTQPSRLLYPVPSRPPSTIKAQATLRPRCAGTATEGDTGRSAGCLLEACVDTAVPVSCGRSHLTQAELTQNVTLQGWIRSPWSP